MPRAVWKGAIAFGLVHSPVTLYPASGARRLDLDLLDRRDFAPVGYQRINKRSGEAVAAEDIVKGYEYEDGQYVVVSEEDFRLANVEATQTVDLLSFVDAAGIPPMYFDTPYYLEPGRRGEKGYALLRETLRRSGRDEGRAALRDTTPRVGPRHVVHRRGRPGTGPGARQAHVPPARGKARRGVGAGAHARCGRRGLEGLIGKAGEARYVSGRSRHWVKLKCRQRQEFVIGGYSAPGGSRHGFGALLVGLYDAAGALHYAGRVGSGFDAAALARLAPRLAALERDSAPFAKAPRAAGVHWVQPTLVAEVAFAGWTRDGLLRQASFAGLREDKPARAVHEETAVAIRDDKRAAAGPVQVAGIVISHPERVVWPDRGFTKADLARYYAQVGEWLLPQLANRPLSLLRCPDGSAAECFFQRHMGHERPPGVERFVWESASARHRNYLYLANLEAVIGMVRRGVVEFHTWGATLPRADRPDRMTLDLDPAPDLPWETVVEGARLVRALLDELGLASFLKTTGGKGLHLVVPLVRRHSWDEVKRFSHALADHLARALPERFTAGMAKQRRVGRIFIDYLRNDAGASAVAAYAARARPGAPVSTPLAWDELAPQLRPADFTIETLPTRLEALKTDPWAGYAATRQSLTKAMWAALGAR